MDATKPTTPDPTNSTATIARAPTPDEDNAPLEYLIWLNPEVDPDSFLQILRETLKTGYEIKDILFMPEPDTPFFFGIFDERAITFLLSCPERTGHCRG